MRDNYDEDIVQEARRIANEEKEEYGDADHLQEQERYWRKTRL